ncbi:MAG: sigma 54-interacting transcriptional regulator [Myxococcota bacterium]
MFLRSNAPAATIPAGEQTASLLVDLAATRTSLGRFALEDVATGERFLRDGEVVTSIGSEAANDVRLADQTVSRFHCRITLDANGACLTDVGSSNGTFVNGMRVARAWLLDGAVLELGSKRLRFVVEPGERFVPLGGESFGSLVGVSARSRRFFSELERASSSDATLLLTGPTGTGKTEAARAVHDASRRTARPFEVVDLASVTRTLLASELFGHEKGAFTGAIDERAGPFERAYGGTLFLDEIGELPLEHQAVLLRVLENRRVRRVGAAVERPVDVRVIAATHRDLRKAVNEGSFRADLFYRLAVVEVDVPSLEERPEDIRILSEALLRSMGYDAAEISADQMHRLMRAAWPGNVRQLRNRLERLMLFGALDEGDAPIDTHFSAARKAAVAAFETRYVRELMQAYGDDVAAAAAAAGIARGYLYRLIKKSGV